MKILYLNAYLNRYDFWTGERGRQFVSALVTAGAEVRTLPDIPSNSQQTTRQPSGFAGRLKQLAKAKLPAKPLMNLIEIHLIARGLVRTLHLTWQAWRKRRGVRPDVVLARTFEYDWAPWLVAMILRRPLILEVHAPFFLERRFRGRSKSGFLRWYEGILWRRAAYIWVHTSELKNIVASNQVKPEHIRVIPFGVPEGRLSEPVQHRNGTQVQVVFVGSFYPWHGVDQLIEAFAIAHEQANNLRLCLVGEGITRVANERRVQALEIENYVEFTGWLSQESMRLYLKNSDIGVAPYLNMEPFYFEPVKLLDYMAAGLPVVASDHGQIRELVTHGESGILVPPEDVSALAQALVELANDAPLRHRLGIVARKQVPTLLDTAQRVLAVSCEAMAAQGDTA